MSETKPITPAEARRLWVEALRSGEYWALTLEESLKQAEEHRRNRIASLRKQIAKLEAADLSPARSADG